MDAPEYICVTQMLKATPKEEGGERFIYIEASNEDVDQQSEIVMAKALAESADYFLRYGNLDLDHITMTGLKQGVPNYMLYEIGRPVDARINGKRTFVKGQIYKGDTDVAEKANHFWESITALSPPQRWYPSVGGAVLEKSMEIDPVSKCRRAMVQKVRWTNIGFSKTPVNSSVPTVSTVPIGALTKAWGAAGLDITKALEAGYGTDSATLTGGGALRKQSLHGSPLNYWDFREQVAGAMQSGSITNPTAERLVQFATSQYGLQHDEATQWVERFMRDLSKSMKKRRPA